MPLPDVGFMKEPKHVARPA